MAQAPEIPEATNPFEKRVALTIALLAVVLALVENQGDNAKTSSILKTNEAANQWAYYQSKSIKQNLYETEARLVGFLSTADQESQAETKAQIASEVARYQAEKGEIRRTAEQLVSEAAANSLVNDRCDLASLLLQVAVVVCSVSILSTWKPLWLAGIGLGVAGSFVGVTAFLM